MDLSTSSLKYRLNDAFEGLVFILFITSYDAVHQTAVKIFFTGLCEWGLTILYRAYKKWWIYLRLLYKQAASGLGCADIFFQISQNSSSSFTDCFLLNIITQLFLKLIVRSPFLRGYERHCEHWGALCSVCNHSTLCIYQQYVPLVGKSVAIEYNSSKCIVCNSLLLQVIISLYSNLTPSPDQLLDNNSNPLLVWTISSRYAMAMGR